MLCVTNKISNLGLQLASRRQNLLLVFQTSFLPIWAPVSLTWNRCSLAPTAENQSHSKLLLSGHLFHWRLLYLSLFSYPPLEGCSDLSFPKIPWVPFTVFLQDCYILKTLYITCVKSTSPLIDYFLFYFNSFYKIPTYNILYRIWN